MNLAKIGKWNLRLPAAVVVAVAMLSGPSLHIGKFSSSAVPPPEILGLASAYAATYASVDRGARDYVLESQIPWEGRPGTPNASAKIFGDPNKPGWYLYLLKRGPNDWSKPHSHPNDRFITVLAGTMWIGTGAKLDKENTVPIKAGGFIRDIATQPHYDGTKDDGLTIQIMGMGPATSIPADGK
jgi:hypothetical protein